MTIGSPREIPGLLVWYSAQAITGLAEGAAVPSWQDQSGNNNHATGGGGSAGPPTYRVAGGPSGGASIDFKTNPGGNVFALPNIFTALTAVEIHAYLIGTGVGNDPSHWRFSPGSGCVYPFTDGNVYDHFGTSARQSFTPTLAVASWRRYCVASAVGNWTAWLDGVQQLQSASAGAPSWVTDPYIGGANLGRFTTVLIWNRRLTPAERTDVNAWMTANPSGGIYVPPQPPGVPTAVAVDAVTSTSARLHWAAPATGGVPTDYDVRITETP